MLLQGGKKPRFVCVCFKKNSRSRHYVVKSCGSESGLYFHFFFLPSLFAFFCFPLFNYGWVLLQAFFLFFPFISLPCLFMCHFLTLFGGFLGYYFLFFPATDFFSFSFFLVYFFMRLFSRPVLFAFCWSLWFIICHLVIKFDLLYDESFLYCSRRINNKSSFWDLSKEKVLTFRRNIKRQSFTNHIFISSPVIISRGYI